MKMFSFGFIVDNTDEDDSNGLSAYYGNGDGDGDGKIQIEANDSTHSESISHHLEVVEKITGDNSLFVPFSAGDVQLKGALPSDTSIDCGKDIVPGVYEGGFKCWECSLDLVKFLFDNSFVKAQSRILELGCGHGFPGIAALLQGAREAVFSDLNKEVLQQVTWPNLQLNCSHVLLKASVQCIAGDFFQIPGYHLPMNYNIILSAETLYTSDLCQRMGILLETLLKDDGVALLATKRYYFGVGGGTLSFTSAIDARGILVCEVVKSIEDGQSNIRDIIKVTKKNCNL
jgi:hypothetical protein